MSQRRLATFTKAGYEKGASRTKQALWFALMNLVFYRWWCPARWRVGLLRRFGATIGDRVLIRHRVRVLWPWKLTIGDDCWIGEGAWILNLEPVTIGHDVCISQEAFLCTGSHNARTSSFDYDNAPIVIEPGAWIAARAVVLRGVTVGEAAVVGANATVTRNVDAGASVRAGQCV